MFVWLILIRKFVVNMSTVFNLLALVMENWKELKQLSDGKGLQFSSDVLFIYISTQSPNFIKVSIKRAITFNSTQNVIPNRALITFPWNLEVESLGNEVALLESADPEWTISKIAKLKSRKTIMPHRYFFAPTFQRWLIWPQMLEYYITSVALRNRYSRSIYHLWAYKC